MTVFNLLSIAQIATLFTIPLLMKKRTKRYLFLIGMLRHDVSAVYEAGRVKK